MNVADAVETVLPAALDDLAELVAIPSVSASHEHAPDVQRSARWVHNQLIALGCTDARIVSEGGQPAVIGRFPGPAGAPTICLYAHHDVQPTGDVSLWTGQNPLQVREANGRLEQIEKGLKGDGLIGRNPEQPPRLQRERELPALRLEAPRSGGGRRGGRIGGHQLGISSRSERPDFDPPVAPWRYSKTIRAGRPVENKRWRVEMSRHARSSGPLCAAH